MPRCSRRKVPNARSVFRNPDSLPVIKPRPFSCPTALNRVYAPVLDIEIVRPLPAASLPYVQVAAEGCWTLGLDRQPGLCRPVGPGFHLERSSDVVCPSPLAPACALFRREHRLWGRLDRCTCRHGLGACSACRWWGRRFFPRDHFCRSRCVPLRLLEPIQHGLWFDGQRGRVRGCSVTASEWLGSDGVAATPSHSSLGTCAGRRVALTVVDGVSLARLLAPGGPGALVDVAAPTSGVYPRLCMRAYMQASPTAMGAAGSRGCVFRRRPSQAAPCLKSAAMRVRWRTGPCPASAAAGRARASLCGRAAGIPQSAR
ncbi:hypothetical protein JOF35_005172 [Streptomyces demainii]|uniref:Uncharacterized protein n=1 Tax=Streptomyces demainii TaxID=588122 RepID=A0ABT9KWT1_9ACTN|nr:hypothetical protein [Streptomyces demainii]